MLAEKISQKQSASKAGKSIGATAGISTAAATGSRVRANKVRDEFVKGAALGAVKGAAPAMKKAKLVRKGASGTYNGKKKSNQKRY